MEYSMLFLKYYKLHATHTQNEEHSKHTCGNHDGAEIFCARNYISSKEIGQSREIYTTQHKEYGTMSKIESNGGNFPV